MDDKWLKQTYDFPDTGERGTAVRAEYFMGFDTRNQRWLRFGAMTDGEYFAIVAKRADNSWTWSYVLPGTSGSAVYIKQSDTEYTVDGPTYPQNGKSVT